MRLKAISYASAQSAIAIMVLLATLSLPLPLKSFAQAQPTPLTQQKWQSFASKPGKFSVALPASPQAETVTTNSTSGQSEWTVDKAQTDSGTFAVAYTDLSSQVLEGGSRAFLQSIKNSLLAKLFDWEVINEQGRDISLRGNPGREFLSIRDGKITALRLYLVQERLYGLFATSDNMTHVSQFLDSFELDSIWQPFASDAGRFAVQMPMNPDTETEIMQIEGQQLNWNLFKARNFYAKSDGFAVAYTDLPAGNSQDSEAILQAISQYLLEDGGLQALANSSKDIRLGNYPGKAFLGQKEGNIVALRIYLVNQRLYGLYARSANLSSIDRFFNSFALK